MALASRRRLYVYAGPGASQRCVRATVVALRRISAHRPWRVDTLGAAELVAGLWREDALLVCMPGGRDVPYVHRLGAAGAAQLRGFVRGGGRYLGLCAGAYFAASHIDFAAGKALAVAGRRPLGFFGGLARGPLMDADTFAYHAGRGAELRQVHGARGEGGLPVFNYGGCTFLPNPGAQWPQAAQPLVWAATSSGPQPVCLLARYGRGRALLWGMHPEFDASTVASLQLGPLGRRWAQTLTATASARHALWARHMRMLLHSSC